jgi:hypothetical protein
MGSGMGSGRGRGMRNGTVGREGGTGAPVVAGEMRERGDFGGEVDEVGYMENMGRRKWNGDRTGSGIGIRKNGEWSRKRTGI